MKEINRKDTDTVTHPEERDLNDFTVHTFGEKRLSYLQILYIFLGECTIIKVKTIVAMATYYIGRSVRFILGGCIIHQPVLICICKPSLMSKLWLSHTLPIKMQLIIRLTHAWHAPCFDLTHWGRVTHICVSELTIIGSDNGFVAWTAPSRYLNQWWNIINSNLRNKLQWHPKRN